MKQWKILSTTRLHRLFEETTMRMAAGAREDFSAGGIFGGFFVGCHPPNFEVGV